MKSAQSLDILCILVLIIILFGIYIQKNYIDIKAKRYLILVITGIFSLTVDAVSYTLYKIDSLYNIAMMVDLLGYMSFDFLIMTFSNYMSTLLEMKGSDGRKKINTVTGIICSIDMVVNIAVFSSGKMFTIENGVFRRLEYSAIAEILPLCGMLYLFTIIIQKRRLFNKREIIAIVSYMVFPAIAAVLELFYPELMIIMPTGALSIVFIYVMLQAGDVESAIIRQQLLLEISSKDSMTGLNNRRAYEERLASVSKEDEICVIFCDVNGLKYTNDNFGHAAGDELIKGLVTLLKGCFREEEAFRISGDEFVVLLKNTSPQQCQLKADDLKKEIAIHGQIASVGCSFGEGKDILSLVLKAEEEMYKDKKLYYSRTGRKR